ncbi:MAG: DNA (cytosine-5-)-methyltransferase [Acidimicrobiia bacterium]|nr:DNA (cytosine-5-)-methyltransferase [Acidimicrobiia bacterium]
MPMRAAEFFAGMGLMRAGLESAGVRTVFANDFDGNKAALYRANWGDDALVVDDIRNLRGDDIPDVGVATASFPCTDMSLAGNLAGLEGAESGLIVDFCRILAEMGERRPRAVIVENVPGFRTVNDGRDFAQVVELLEALGYSVEHVLINAASFVPQSRPRVFLLGVRGSHPALPPTPDAVAARLADVASRGGDWWPPERRDAFLASLSLLPPRLSGLPCATNWPNGTVTRPDSGGPPRLLRSRPCVAARGHRRGPAPTRSRRSWRVIARRRCDAVGVGCRTNAGCRREHRRHL